MRLVIGIGVAALVAWVVWSQFLRDPEAPAVERQIVAPAESDNASGQLDQQAQAPSPDPAPVTAEPTGEAKEPRRIEVESQSDFFTIMAELGLENMEQRFSEWSLEHGYPFSDQTGVMLLEQPYDQYDDETLRGLADNEDMWAQQFLAQRLESTRPAEAIDWYRRAAINGSLFAMDQLTALYSRLGRTRSDGPNADAEFKEQLIAVRDSVESTQEMGFAWSMASVMAGGDPGRSRLTLEAMSRTFDEEQTQRACDMATSLYSDISGQRQNRGLPDFSRSPPPLMMGTLGDAAALPCDSSSSVPYVSVSSCEEVVIVLAGTESEMVVCPGG